MATKAFKFLHFWFFLLFTSLCKHAQCLEIHLHVRLYSAFAHTPENARENTETGARLFEKSQVDGKIKACLFRRRGKS
jgi:hypothetical protein